MAGIGQVMSQIAPMLLPLAVKFLKNGGFKSKGFQKLNVRRAKKTKRGPVLKRRMKRGKLGVNKNKKRSSQKRSQLTSNGGGAIMSMPAPVAFARDGEVKATFETMASDYANGTKVHSVDFVGPLTVNASGTVVIGSVTINPTNSGTFPWLSGTVAAGYEKYKLLMLRVHYVHFTSTASQGTVMIMYNSDVLAATPTTESQMQNDSNATEGALYEDIFLDVDLTGMSEDWLYVGTGATDTRLNTAGQVFIGTANAPTTNTYGNVGNYYVEAIWQFVERKLPSQTEPVALLRKICALELPVVTKRKMLHDLVDSMPLIEFSSPQKKQKTDEEAVRDHLEALALGRTKDREKEKDKQSERKYLQL